jgi:hypothetical protein
MDRSYFGATTLIFVSLVGCSCVEASENTGDSSFKLRLAKAPDTSDSNSPATLGYQHSDNGKNDYVTQGAIIWNNYPDDITTIAPALSWNHNTLASTPTDTWKASVGLSKLWFYNCPTCDHNLDRIKWAGSLAQQRDVIKSSNSTTVRLDATWFTNMLVMPPAGTLNFAALRPTMTLFSKRVRDAAKDKVTGITPTGSLNGSALGLAGYVNYGRWYLDASSQSIHVSHDVNGSTPTLHRLSKISLRYEFVDAARTGEELKNSSTQWIPSILITRQVGDDPFNDVAKAGFTQVAFSLQY